MVGVDNLKLVYERLERFGPSQFQGLQFEFKNIFQLVNYFHYI